MVELQWGRICACSLRSRLVLGNFNSFHKIIGKSVSSLSNFRMSYPTQCPLGCGFMIVSKSSKFNHSKNCSLAGIFPCQCPHGCGFTMVSSRCRRWHLKKRCPKVWRYPGSCLQGCGIWIVNETHKIEHIKKHCKVWTLEYSAHLVHTGLTDGAVLHCSMHFAGLPLGFKRAQMLCLSLNADG